MHGYIANSIENETKIDHKASKSWARNRDMSSEFKAYAFAIEDQEIATKYVKAKRQKRSTWNTPIVTRCRHCKSANEDIIHIIASCLMMCGCVCVITYLFHMKLLQKVFIMDLYITKIHHTENMI